MDSGGEKVRGHSTEEGDDASSVCHQFSSMLLFLKDLIKHSAFPSLGQELNDVIWGGENQDGFLMMMQFLDSILPHQVECGVVWSKLLSTDPEIDLKEVILILKWNFKEIKWKLSSYKKANFSLCSNIGCLRWKEEEISKGRRRVLWLMNVITRF